MIFAFNPMSILKCLKHYCESKSLPFLLILTLMLNGCITDYQEVQKKEVSQVFMIHSSPTFEGYHYRGSDDTYHYFVSKWRYGADRKFKISTSDLKIARTTALGNAEKRLFLLKPNKLKSRPFASIGDRTLYVLDE